MLFKFFIDFVDFLNFYLIFLSQKFTWSFQEWLRNSLINPILRQISGHRPEPGTFAMLRRWFNPSYDICGLDEFPFYPLLTNEEVTGGTNLRSPKFITPWTSVQKFTRLETPYLIISTIINVTRSVSQKLFRLINWTKPDVVKRFRTHVTYMI